MTLATSLWGLIFASLFWLVTYNTFMAIQESRLARRRWALIAELSKNHWQ